MKRTRFALASALGLVALVACQPGGKTAVERGRVVYQINCIACHHPDPRRAGSVGPEVAGSSAELLRARMLRAEYPPGYTPKQDSKLMPAQPHLAKDIDDLAAYLAAPE